ncbi:MAG TPA: hypothetical protein ENI54_06345, partial [bacterium]|nr:hypothetical protein [bacterium]
MKKNSNFLNDVMAKILIYGGGNAAKTLMEMFLDDKNVVTVALVARNLTNEGVLYAKKLNIRCFKTIKEVKDNGIN